MTEVDANSDVELMPTKRRKVPVNDAIEAASERNTTYARTTVMQ